MSLCPPRALGRLGVQPGCCSRTLAVLVALPISPGHTALSLSPLPPGVPGSHPVPRSGAVSQLCSAAPQTLSAPSARGTTALPSPSLEPTASQRSGWPSDSGRQPVNVTPGLVPAPQPRGAKGTNPRDQTSLLCARASLRDESSQLSPSSLVASQVTVTRIIGSGGGTRGPGRGQGGTVTEAEAAW